MDENQNNMSNQPGNMEGIGGESENHVGRNVIIAVVAVIILILIILAFIGSDNSGAPTVGDDEALTDDERQELLDSLRSDIPEGEPITDDERQELLDSLRSDIPEGEPITDEERQNILDSLRQ